MNTTAHMHTHKHTEFILTEAEHNSTSETESSNSASESMVDFINDESVEQGTPPPIKHPPNMCDVTMEETPPPLPPPISQLYTAPPRSPPTHTLAIIPPMRTQCSTQGERLTRRDTLLRAMQDQIQAADYHYKDKPPRPPIFQAHST